MNLQEFFKEHKKIALAFSGGTDSAYLLYEAVQCGCDIRAYYVKSVFQPQFELDDAQRLSKELKASLTVLELDVLSEPLIKENDTSRCYHCKKKIFQRIFEAARKDGYEILIDGTNASDLAKDRPGMKALRELGVRSPLKECGLTKSDVRRLSEEAELFTWDKPAYACLATRIPVGTKINAERLHTTETAEKFLTGLGFSDFRIRLIGTGARIELREEQFEKLLLYRREILTTLKSYYTFVSLDLEARP